LRLHRFGAVPAVAAFDRWHVINLDRLTYAATRTSLDLEGEERSERYQLVEGNIADPEVVEDLLSR
jgi:dTDP-D-glucose 4,6-dehydratase